MSEVVFSAVALAWINVRWASRISLRIERWRGLTDVGGKLIDKNKAKKFGASETLSKQQDAKRDMIQSIMEQRKAKTDQIAKDKEAKAKTTKMLLIGGGVVLAVGLIIGVIYAVKKSKSKK